MASPKDRIAASFLDVILMLPLVQLLQAPVKKWILESVLFNDAINASYFRIVNLFIFIFVFIVYYTLMTCWRGQTIGKIFFRIRVISYVGSLTLMSSLVRSFAIFVESLFCGIPFLAMFSHPMRRPMHDRLADTLVISEHNPVGFPDHIEKLKVAFLGVSIAVLLFCFGFLYSVNYMQSFSSESVRNDNCQYVQNVERGLESVVEMYLVGRIGPRCLLEEARASLWKRENEPIAKFAMALATVNKMEKSNSYLMAICDEKDHYLCEFSQWLKRTVSGEEMDLVHLEKIMSRPGADSFAKVFALAFLRKKGQYEKMEALLKTIEKSTELEPILATMTLFSLLGQFKWDEAFWIFKTHDNLTDQDILSFLNFEMENQFIGQDEQMQLIEHFYPGVIDYSSRSPASTSVYSDEIRDIYIQLKEEK